MLPSYLHPFLLVFLGGFVVMLRLVFHVLPLPPGQVTGDGQVGCFASNSTCKYYLYIRHDSCPGECVLYGHFEPGGFNFFVGDLVAGYSLGLLLVHQVPVDQICVELAGSSNRFQYLQDVYSSCGSISCCGAFRPWRSP